MKFKTIFNFVAKRCLNVVAFLSLFSGLLILFNHDVFDISPHLLIVAPKYTGILPLKPLLFRPHSYRYWRDRNLMLPRGLTVKEHKQVMALVEIAASIFARLQTEYLVVSGSLLGE